uniref:F-box/kelch-repeat protein At3g23880-like n=1 Tax=Erigeron canadensis TaxID=72917 RepID=UPI001CB96414|nr:F-box/kelch-repeat protein At3g23880-like [Erigeron canadensis]
MEKLTEDVLSNIFIRLPAKQLVQMRCVCKPWSAFLSESYFIKSHLNHSNKDNEIVLLFDVAFDYGILSYQAFPCAAHDLSKSPVIQLNDHVKLPFNFPQSALNKYGGHVIGSVNGLICFYIGRYYDVKGIYIWNPSLSVIMCLTDVHTGGYRELGFGFGFDPKTDDYKVVKLPDDNHESGRWREPVEVYSMKKGSWEFIVDKFPKGVHRYPKDVSKCYIDNHDGHIHWLCYYFNNKVVRIIKTIVAYNLGGESFRHISLPDSIAYNDQYRWHNVLSMLGGKLCVVSCARGDDGKFEVWVMNEYGVADSWVKSHVLSKLNLEAGTCRRPFGFTLNNKFLFYDRSRGLLGWYDQDIDKVTHFRSDTADPTRVVQYVDSLVWYAAPTT